MADIFNFTKWLSKDNGQLKIMKKIQILCLNGPIPRDFRLNACLSSGEMYPGFLLGKCKVPTSPGD